MRTKAMHFLETSAHFSTDYYLTWYLQDICKIILFVMLVRKGKTQILSNSPKWKRKIMVDFVYFAFCLDYRPRIGLSCFELGDIFCFHCIGDFLNIKCDNRYKLMTFWRLLQINWLYCWFNICTFILWIQGKRFLLLL